jgi:hypothetical protein
MMRAATARPRPAWSWVRVFRIETAAKMTAARLPSPPIHNRLHTNAVMAVPLYGRCVAVRYPYDCEIPTVFCPSIDLGSSCRNVREPGCTWAKINRTADAASCGPYELGRVTGTSIRGWLSD